MAKNHPKGLVVLALTNLGERFGYYTMLAILALYLQAKFGFSSATTSLIYGSFLALVYFLPVFGGIIADKWLGYGKTILMGVSVMFAGYLLLALPMGTEAFGIFIMALSLILISAGTGLFKGNLQALVGKMYDDPRYSKNRDMAFSIFYMFINIGAFFAPSMGNFITNQVLGKEGFYYDASIPANYVALNDKVVDKDTFIATYANKHEKYLSATSDEQQEMIKHAKKKEGVMFQEDLDNHLFNLKFAALTQYSRGIQPILTPEQEDLYISPEEQEIMNDRSNSSDVIEKKEAVISKVKNAQITDPAMLKKMGLDAEGDFATNFGKVYVAKTLSVSYSFAFAVACISLIISILIFMLFRSTWKAADVTAKHATKASHGHAPTMSPKEVRDRMMALILVFIVVIFFWMAFHQNGLTMTFFARDYTISKVGNIHFMAFALWALIPFAIFMYGIYLSTFGLLGGKKQPKTGALLLVLGIIGLAAAYFLGAKPLVGDQKITPQIFQQFNPFFIILLTPVTVGIFAALARKGKEPSAPRKIGIGMLLAAVGFCVLLIGSYHLPAPSTLSGPSDQLVSPNWLISTYFVLTLAELFLSPMGLSFVSKVAPPQYSGLMQGGWLAATAVGNLLVGFMGALWDKMGLAAFWGILIACCLLSAAFIFSIMKKLEKVTNDNNEVQQAVEEAIEQ